MTKKILNLCVSHRSPIFPPKIPYVMVSPNVSRETMTIVAPDKWHGELYDGNVISEYSQLFFLVKNKPEILDFSHLYIFQYRKFVSNIECGIGSENIPWSRVISLKNASEMINLDNNRDLNEIDYFSGPIFEVERSVAHQYSRHHLIEDLMLFVLAMRQNPYFDDEACNAFVSSTQLIPSPALGMIPSQVFFDIHTIMMNVWETFFNKFYKPRTDYQRRVGGFLLERLHSFLLLRNIRVNDRHISGNLYTVSETEKILRTI